MEKHLITTTISTNDNLPYLNLPIPMRNSALVSNDNALDPTNGNAWYRGNNNTFGNQMGGLQTAYTKLTGLEF